MVLSENTKIVLDPVMMRQYAVISGMMNKEIDRISELKKEFRQFNNIGTIDEARELVYKLYPKFKDNSTFCEMGVKYMIHDTEDNLRILAWFSDEIIVYDFI